MQASLPTRALFAEAGNSLIGDGLLVEAEADAWAEVLPQAAGAVGSQDPE